METYFRIKYEFDRNVVFERIAQAVARGDSEYICVADGVILNIANRKNEYLSVVNGSMFSICDSSYVPVYLKWIYGIKRQQYCGSQILIDMVRARKYRMIFMGTSQLTLDALKASLTKENPDIANMTFVELPFKRVEEFDYASIAKMIGNDGADIIWVALGAPKQEIFMNRLKQHLEHSVMIAVGAAFKFYSGLEEKRAPKWMRSMHLEFAYRIIKDPKKQVKRCAWIIVTLPVLLVQEIIRKHKVGRKRPKKAYLKHL